MSYQLSNKAEEDIISLFVDGAKLFGLEQANRYHAELEETFLFLTENPLANREQSEFMPAVRVHPFQSHLIVYTLPKKDELLIVRVLHKREDWRNKII